MKKKYWAHATAVIDRGARVGDGTKIWHFSHVMRGARIGARCMLGQNVFVASGVIVGDGCRIQNGVSLYEGVTLHEDVFVGPSAVFTNVRAPRAAIDRSAEVEVTVLERGVTIGANATIVCGTRIEEHAFIAAGAVVTSHVPAHGLVAGSPARRISWVCRCGATRGSAQKIRGCDCNAGRSRRAGQGTGP